MSFIAVQTFKQTKLSALVVTAYPGYFLGTPDIVASGPLGQHVNNLYPISLVMNEKLEKLEHFYHVVGHNLSSPTLFARFSHRFRNKY